MKVDGVDTYTSVVSVQQPVDESLTKPNMKNSVMLAEVEQEKSEKISYEEGQKTGVDKDELLGMLEKVNKFAEVQKVNLRLRMDDETEKLIVSVIDKNTEEVIRQIPSEHAVKLAMNIEEAMQEFFSSNPDHVMSFLADKA